MAGSRSCIRICRNFLTRTRSNEGGTRQSVPPSLFPFPFCYDNCMPKSKLAKIQFCFPKFSGKNKKAFVDALIRDVPLDKKIGYAGYSKRMHLRNDISWRFANSNIREYRPLPNSKRKRIGKLILSILQKCHRKLPAPVFPLFVFIFPWLGPFDKNDRLMGRVTGFTPYNNTFHIFVSPSEFSSKSLRQTIAHEFNHAAFFHYHPLNPNNQSSKQTIRDVLIWEGLAENFTKEITKAESPIATALTEEKAVKAFHKLKPMLDTWVKEKNDAYETIFFGGSGYKKWTGYSIGYHIVRIFRIAYPKKSWRKIIMMNPRWIFDKSPFTKIEAQ